MRKCIELTEIQTSGNRILCTMQDKSGLHLLRSEKVHAWIQYDHTEAFGIDFSKLPLSVLAIPVTLYLLPITYYYDVELVVPVMDKMLYERLPDIFAAYKKIYGAIPADKNVQNWVHANRLEENKLVASSEYKKIVFFSGGVDACSAGVNNAGPASVLVSIPSIEVHSRNEGALREAKYSLIKDFSAVSESPWVLIANNFNDDVFNDSEIQMRLKQYLTSEAFRFDGWYGIKYLANMSSVAPLAYALGIPELVMGSAYEQLEDKSFANQSGANPELSDSICYAGIHFAEQDALHTRRQAKTANVIKWCKAHDKKVRIWTCFDDKPYQCGKCGKCVRTQLNILTCSENPKDWGFEKFDEEKFSRLIMRYRYWEKNACWLWDNIEAIDASKTYPCCDKMLHWLKGIGYKSYLEKARSISIMQKFFRRLLKVYRYPYYALAVLNRIRKF